MTRRIVFSTNENPTYAWFCPLASLAWQRVAGFSPLVLMVGAVDPWIVEKTAETGADVVRLVNIRGISSGAFAQFSRLFAYLLPGVQSDDYLLTVDSDAWPCQRGPFQPSGADFDALYPNWCIKPDWGPGSALPIGYLGAEASTWRELVGVDSASIEEAVIKVNQTDPEIRRRREVEHTEQPFWNYDEAYITSRVRAWSGFPSRCHLVARVGGDLINDRIDRLRWPGDPRPEGMVDAHLLRPGWTEENWPRLRPLFSRIVTPGDLAWADAYRADYMRRNP